MTGHLVSHLVRRGVEHASSQLTAKQAYMNRLQHDAELYDNEGQEVRPQAFLPMVITMVIAFLIIFSIDYTIGQVMASLAMIETPTHTAIIESKPPAYADEPDAPLEKEALIPSEAEADVDVEVTVIDHKPITAKITTTIGHLHRIGGFTARWRGIGLSVAYHFLHASITNLFASLLGFGIAGESLVSVFVSVALCRVHMAWTHKMISYPTNKPWYRRLPARKDCKPLLLPALVYAIAQQATILMPVGVAFALGVAGPNVYTFHDRTAQRNCSNLIITGLRLLAVPVTYIAVAFLVLLPASVTLTRIEATLLPEGEDTIVPFDKAAMLQDIDVSVRAGRRALFVEAWRSFDRASRWRLIKLYAKMILAEVTIAFVALHLVVAELFILGSERMAIFFKSAAAQAKLAIIEAHEKTN